MLVACARVAHATLLMQAASHVYWIRKRMPPLVLHMGSPPHKSALRSSHFKPMASLLRLCSSRRRPTMGPAPMWPALQRCGNNSACDCEEQHVQHLLLLPLAAVLQHASTVHCMREICDMAMAITRAVLYDRTPWCRFARSTDPS
jgi:hypothetical protein